MPYSFTDLKLHLAELRALHAPFLTIGSIGKSLGGLSVPIVRVTSGGEGVRPVIVVIGR